MPKTKEVLTNVPSMNVTRAVDILSNAYISVIKKGKPVFDIPSVMLWGAPGVGKSQGIREIASKIEKETNKKVNITDVRLLLFNPIDLRGIPTANVDKTLAIWLKPQIFNMDESEDVINILFLDELSAAPQSVQTAAYQITLDRIIGEHKLPDNCIVIAAGNRVTDKSVAYKMPKALANRLLHIEIESNFDSWHTWAITKRINSKVMGFLAFKRNRLMDYDVSRDDLAFATPRSWELVSNLLNTVEDEENNLIDLIAGLVGYGTAIEFSTWLKVYDKLPSIESIFKGTCKEIPTSIDTLFAVCSSIISYAAEHSDDIKGIENAIKYAKKLPTEYSILTLKDFLCINKELKKTLLSNKEFSDWIQEKGTIVNALN